jgi:RNA 2',3'-cyclic 3'-phosphodiesterase
MGGSDTVERLFIAVPLTDQAREKIAAALPPLPGRRVPPQNWHFTLRFLGDMERARRDQLAAILRRTRLSRTFSIRFDGLGAFPRAKRARIIWLGVTDGARELVSLAEAVESLVRRSDFPAEKRPFKPHLTLSRVEPPRAVANLLDAQPALDVTMPVSEVVLVRSSLGAGPAKYEVVEEFLLDESQ